MIAKLKALEWKAAGWATLIVFSVIGLACVIAFFDTNWRPWYVLPAILLAASWWVAFRLAASVPSYAAHRAEPPCLTDGTIVKDPERRPLTPWREATSRDVTSALVNLGYTRMSAEVAVRMALRAGHQGFDELFLQASRLMVRNPHSRIRADEGSRVRRARASGRRVDVPADDSREFN